MGVPQVSVLGPFFFEYINDLPLVIPLLSDIVLFSDNTLLIFEVTPQCIDAVKITKLIYCKVLNALKK